MPALVRNIAFGQKNTDFRVGGNALQLPHQTIGTIAQTARNIWKNNRIFPTGLTFMQRAV
jgi:hypothetical protein